MYNLISVGDSSVDAFLQIKDADKVCNIKKNTCQLCVGFSDEINLESIKYVRGAGNASNIAIGVSRLNLSSAIYTIIGNDFDGDGIESVLKSEKVSLDYVNKDRNKPTDSAIVLLYGQERTFFIKHENRRYGVPSFAKSDWIFLGCLGQDPQDLHNNILRHCINNNVKLAFNPGPIQLQQGVENLLPVLKNTEVLFINRMEAQTFLNVRNKPKSLIKLLENFGPKIVVLTDGMNGSFSYDGENIYYLESFGAPNIEGTGCGDAYASAFLSALHYKYDIQNAMRWGTFNASSVLQFIGSHDGLLTKNKIINMCSSNQSFKPVIVK